MKKYYFAFLLLPLLFLFSCTDLDDINRRLDDHEARLKTLESLIQNANNDVKLVQTLLDAQRKLISIVSYNELSDKSGYELTLSDGSKIELKNGKDGEAPIISVKEHTDGLLYWTINGEFMLDADSNMIKAEGIDGQDGVAPVIRVNISGHWEVSTDKGKTWQLILDSAGNPIIAKGKDGTVDLLITETENSLIITYNGYTYNIYQGEQKVPVSSVTLYPTEKLLIVDDIFHLVVTVLPTYAHNKDVSWHSSNETVAIVDNEGNVTAKSPGSTTITVTTVDGSKNATCEINVQERPKLPIEFVTEFNINESADGFASSHLNSLNGFFNWEEAMAKFAPDKNFNVDGKNYYLPTQEEWNGIIPNNASGTNIHFRLKRNKLGINETITINSNTNEYSADYISTGDSLAYGVRLIDDGNFYRSAYRYHYTNNPTGGYMVTVTVRYLGPNSSSSIDEVANEEWWSNNNSKDILRVFSLAGQIKDGEPNQSGTFGYYWSTTEINIERARTLYLGSFPTSSGNYYKINVYPVRLFIRE